MENDLETNKQNIYFSEVFDKQSVLLCLEKNFLNILPALNVRFQVRDLSNMLDDKNSIKQFVYENNKILFFHVGKIEGNKYIVNYFCWNFYSRPVQHSDFYKYKKIVAKILVTDIKLKYPHLNQLIIAIMKTRSRKESFYKLLKKTFKNIKQELNVPSKYENFDIFSVDLHKECKHIGNG
jgi:hypothetical protein